MWSPSVKSSPVSVRLSVVKWCRCCWWWWWLHNISTITFFGKHTHNNDARLLSCGQPHTMSGWLLRWRYLWTTEIMLMDGIAGGQSCLWCDFIVSPWNFITLFLSLLLLPAASLRAIYSVSEQEKKDLLRCLKWSMFVIPRITCPERIWNFRVLPKASWRIRL